ncbi:MAG: hypothetical protein AAB919_03020 [Patescibacteria group bacterium]
MLAPVISGPVGLTDRQLLDAAMQTNPREFDLDRIVFEKAYGPLEYRPTFEHFCRKGTLPPLVIAFCQAIVRGEIS